jgi:hypothetical protein
MQMRKCFAPSEFLALDRDIRAAISRAIRACPNKTREMIAEDLSKATGVRVSLRMLNDYTADSRAPYRFPAAWVIPFCEITGDNSLRSALLGPRLEETLHLGERVIKVMGMKTTALGRPEETDAE